jgi:DNA (cytosine-5)-methyltransferase 1
MIRVGTDCSGIEAPIQALKKLKIPFTHEFSCEKDLYCQQSIEANYSPKVFFSDITKRKYSDIPDIDLYICGFPCQPFSSAGLRNGVYDIRGTIFYYCIKTIRAKLPTYFILENVRGLTTIDGGNVFQYILKQLENIKKYDIYWKVLNTKDYGIPQNRERIFIIGILKSQRQPFEWPKPTKMKNIYNYIDTTNTEEEPIPNYLKRANFFKKIPKDAVFVNIGFTQDKFITSDRICPCLTTSNQLWCVPLTRRATVSEYLKLQGFPTTFKQVVSDTQMKKQVGNSMSVNVLYSIFKQLFLY